jgi:hypothetical protein
MIPVASVIVRVTAAAMAQAIDGPEQWREVQGIASPVAGKGLALSTGTIGCS